MSFSYELGGWGKTSQGTSNTPIAIPSIGWMKAAACSLLLLTTTPNPQALIQEHIQPKKLVQRNVDTATKSRPSVVAARSPQENLNHIRAVLNPSISALAETLDVSRQTLYNWMKGDDISSENAERLYELARAADILVKEDIVVDSALMKRKYMNGMTLLHAIKNGVPAQEAAENLVNLCRSDAAEREHLNAIFAKRSSFKSSSDFDLPEHS
ncbi:TPA: helix-turn-helix domain-containing protein [Aeromonas hydrophila]|nr:hypothetical protein [Aeromonas dhakensis]